MNSFMWKEDILETQFKNASKEMEQFFDEMREEKKNLGTDVKLVYRKGQHQFARDIMNGIRNNQIVLVQAGVGIGKSMGYLVPVIETINQVENFHKIIISTSSIALQQQLLTDVNFISNLIGVEIKVAIAKGINNYVCLRRIEQLIAVSDKYQDREMKKILLNVIQQMKKANTIDKDNLDLRKLTDETLEKIQMRGSCSGCRYSRNCLYHEIYKDIMRADIVITNHGNFVKAVMDDRDYVNEADMYIFDEAHKLEGTISSLQQGTLTLKEIQGNILFYAENRLLTSDESLDNIDSLLLELDKLFLTVKIQITQYFKEHMNEENGIRVTDCEMIPFDNHGLKSNVYKRFYRLIRDIQNISYYRDNYRLNTLIGYYNIFKDMIKEENENIYWANYFGNDQIHIGYVSKSNINITQKIFGKGIPTVCTSATLLDANGKYNYFKKNLSFDKIRFSNQSIVDGKVYSSPYDYDSNSLFYYDTTIANPKDNYIQYETDLAERIRELLQVTNGRTLVLFTAKSTMENVYRALQEEEFDFRIMLQGSSMDNDAKILKKFTSDVKSCLFATGAFWEGVNISGKSLCNVIITRLPFDNVNAISEYKASQYSERARFREVYLNDMVMKVAQGAGRLIRSSRDKGIVCCLDSRCVKYLDSIKRCTSYCNFTSNIKEVYDFSDRYIVNRDGKRRVRERSNIGIE